MENKIIEKILSYEEVQKQIANSHQVQYFNRDTGEQFYVDNTKFAIISVKDGIATVSFTTKPLMDKWNRDTHYAPMDSTHGYFIGTELHFDIDYITNEVALLTSDIDIDDGPF